MTRPQALWHSVGFGVVYLLLSWYLIIGAAQTPIENTRETSIPSAEPPPRLVIETGGHTALIREIIFTADGRELISAGDDKTVRVWAVAPDGRHARLARVIRGQLDDGEVGALRAVALSPPEADGRQRWLAVGGVLAGARDEDRYAIRLHDYASGQVVALLRGHCNTILALAFALTGHWLASA